ncbi:hypothetical protein OIU79_030917 [Salix purpurea]|uniref:Uncharacterized protein n=1 Tax=Salix purpurea TaxID=77065 RepID=A0A9Q0ZS45_SALPP|nr:hypothetical protein OIU79_030917 [Salix purpurea]
MIQNEKHGNLIIIWSVNILGSLHLTNPTFQDLQDLMQEIKKRPIIYLYMSGKTNLAY